MALEFSPLPVRCLFRLVALSRLSVDTSWRHSYSKRSKQVCFTTSPTPAPPPAHPLATLSMKFMPTWKNHLKVPKIQAVASYKVSHVLASEYISVLMLYKINLALHKLWLVSSGWIFKIGISRNTLCDNLVGFPKSGRKWSLSTIVLNSGDWHENIWLPASAFI